MAPHRLAVKNSLQLSDFQKTTHVARSLLMASMAARTRSETPFLHAWNHPTAPPTCTTTRREPAFTLGVNLLPDASLVQA